jgi:hypothetical protein
MRGLTDDGWCGQVSIQWRVLRTFERTVHATRHQRVIPNIRTLTPHLSQVLEQPGGVLEQQVLEQGLEHEFESSAGECVHVSDFKPF